MELRDRVKETTTTQGTGTLTLDAAVATFRRFADAFGYTAGSGSAVVPYAIVAGSEFEVGQGTGSITGGGTHQLTRDTVWESSNAGALVSWGEGTKTVFLPIPGERVLVKDASNVVGVAASVLTLMGADGSLQVNEASQGTGFIWHQGRVAQTLATKGSVKLPNGLIIKWNTVSNVTNDSTATDTFTTAFPAAFYVALLSFQAALDVSAQSGFLSYEKDALTGIKLHNGTNTTKNISYVAVGS